MIDTDSVITNKFEEYMFSSIKDYPRTIVYVDGEDIRLAYALKIFKKYNNSQTVILGRSGIISKNIKEAGLDNCETIEIIEPKKSSRFEECKKLLIDTFVKKNKELSEETAEELASKPNYYATFMLKSGDAHCGVSGSLSPTSAMMKPIIQVLGTGTPKRHLSGAVMQIVTDCPYGLDGKFIFSDVAVIPYPDEQQMTDIVLASYQTAKALYDGEPKIAMLSYSTKGSATSDKIEQIRRVVERVRDINPSIAIDGELQFDAAVVPGVARSKCPDSKVAGKANVLIFPDLDSANICIKAVNRLARTKYYGTIIQGSPIPFNDLSRGSPPIEIVKLTGLTLMQLKRLEKED